MGPEVREARNPRWVSRYRVGETSSPSCIGQRERGVDLVERSGGGPESDRTRGAEVAPALVGPAVDRIEGEENTEEGADDDERLCSSVGRKAHQREAQGRGSGEDERDVPQ